MSDPLDVMAEAAAKLGGANDADVFLYSASISRGNAQQFRALIPPPATRKKNAYLVLCTTGGDPDAAFIIARALKRCYSKFIVAVYGLCKSAGTLVILGADEIVMSDCGELGPLDIQLGKDDELFKRGSGLDLSEAIRFLRQLSWETFQQNFLKLKQGTNITTKTAAEIAQRIAAGIVEPIASQIDPVKLGEIQRSLVIAREYGRLLNPEFEEFDKLISGYPSHGFVIDRGQAKELFKNVRDVSNTEADFVASLGEWARSPVDIVHRFEPIPPTPPPDALNTPQPTGPGDPPPAAPADAPQGET